MHLPPFYITLFARRGKDVFNELLNPTQNTVEGYVSVQRVSSVTIFEQSIVHTWLLHLYKSYSYKTHVYKTSLFTLNGNKSALIKMYFRSVFFFMRGNYYWAISTGMIWRSGDIFGPPYHLLLFRHRYQFAQVPTLIQARKNVSYGCFGHREITPVFP